MKRKMEGVRTVREEEAAVPCGHVVFATVQAVVTSCLWQACQPRSFDSVSWLGASLVTGATSGAGGQVRQLLLLMMVSSDI